MTKPWVISLAAFVLVSASSLFWHWSAGIAFGKHQVRFETQLGEMAFSVWLGSSEYEMNAPVFWANEADPRTSLANPDREKFGGLSWIGRRHNYWAGARSIGVTAPWWCCLIGLLATLNSRRFARLGLRLVRSKERR